MAYLCKGSRYLAACIAGSMAMNAAAAADDTDKGLLIGLGVTAATGKTSLGEGAGAIEAGLLNQEALQQTGAIIAMVTNAAAGVPKGIGRRVLVLSRAETVDFALPVVLERRLKLVREGLNRACTAAEPPKPQKGRRASVFDKSAEMSLTEGEQPATAAKPGFWGGSLRASDLLGATMVDRSIGGVTAPVEDRQLVNAIVMNRTQPAGIYNATLNAWNVWRNPIATTATTTETLEERQARGAPNALGGVLAETKLPPEAQDYILYGEPRELDTDSDLYREFDRLDQAVTDWQRDCPSYNAEKAKTWFEAANAIISGSLSTEKGAAPLTVAAQLSAMRKGKAPLILRVSVDQAGGTTISRTGVLYALGLPNAATVGAGLITSFRLVEPGGGAIVRQGVVRCAVRQTNIRRVPELLAHREYRKSATQPRPLGETVCDFKVA